MVLKGTNWKKKELVLPQGKTKIKSKFPISWTNLTYQRNSAPSHNSYFSFQFSSLCGILEVCNNSIGFWINRPTLNSCHLVFVTFVLVQKKLINYQKKKKLPISWGLLREFLDNTYMELKCNASIRYCNSTRFLSRA